MIHVPQSRASHPGPQSGRPPSTLEPPVSTSADQVSVALADKYRVERELGQGGMATVYLADDLKHRRKVALKVLKPELAAVLGADRFVQEITTTAALQHPHILPLFDSGEAGGFLYYVMPFIDGETLRTRLDRETQLGIDDSIRIAVAVADALDYAHRQGVIHRDIKPENILLHEGRPMVADFGIALALSAAAGGRMTETGLSLGTPHYMSPEQATAAKEISARSDVYSLASVLYEMLTGDPPHTGASAQQIIMKIVTEEAAPVTKIRKSVPRNVADAIATALEKLPADRFESARAFADALADRSYSTSVGMPGHGRLAPAQGIRWRRIAAVLAVVSVFATAGAAVGWMREAPSGQVRRFYVTMSQALIDFGNPLLSADGSRLIYTNLEGSLMLREASSLVSRPIPGTAAAWGTGFSPDGREIAFITGLPGALKVVPLDGGAPRTIVSDSTFGIGLDWASDGWIYFMHGGDYGRDLMRVPAGGGKAEFVARPDTAAGELMYFAPQLLPGGKLILLGVQPRSGESTIGVLDRRTGKVSTISRGSFGRYVASGHLVVVQADGALQAAPFDAKNGRLRKSLVTVEEGLAIWTAMLPVFAVSGEGTLAYQPAPSPGQVVRVQRERGEESVLDGDWSGRFLTPALSPDGSRLAIAVSRGGRSELWARELATGLLTRLSSGGTENYRPGWSPDGREVIFTSDQNGKRTTFRVPADGSSPPTRLLELRFTVDEAGYSRDGRWIVFRAGSGGGRDIYAYRVGGGSDSLHPLVTSQAEEFSPTLSPDGRWLAYAAEETGRTEVYVRPFPNTGSAKYAVSRNGGSEPVWAPSGRELFFRDGNGDLVAAELAPGEELRVVRLRPLFSARAYVADNRHRGYDVAPDGNSFIFVRAPGLLSGSTHVVMTLNWFEELRRKVGQ
jgi:eukaryotic-like serine/threonine-protein kinase